MRPSSFHIGIIFYGEIYNHLELRAELLRQGHVFRSDHPDKSGDPAHYGIQPSIKVHGLPNLVWLFTVCIKVNSRQHFSQQAHEKKQQTVKSHTKFGRP